MTNSIELLKERFELLPRDAQEAIKQFEYDKALKEIHSTYKLHIDQAYTLETAVANVIFGELETSELISFLQTELRLSQETATQLAVEVNNKVLIPIQEKMKTIQAQGDL